MHRCQVRITALVNGKNKVISSISFIIFVCERVCVFRIYIYILQLGCHPVAVVILHVHKT